MYVSPPLTHILSAIGTLTHKIAKFLVPILHCVTINEFTIKGSFLFVKVIVEKDSSSCKGNLDVHWLLTDILIEETITIFSESIYKQNNNAEDLRKSQIKKRLSLATKESYFIFNESLNKHIDGAVMGSSLGLTFANAFLSFYNKMWLQQSWWISVSLLEKICIIVTKYFDKNKKIVEKWIRPENVNVCFCVSFDCNYQKFIFGEETVY